MWTQLRISPFYGGSSHQLSIITIRDENSRERAVLKLEGPKDQTESLPSALSFVSISILVTTQLDIIDCHL